MSAPLVPIGTRVAVPVQRGGAPGVMRLTVVGYTVTGTGARGMLSAETAQGWQDADPEPDAPSARVWAVLTAADGTRAGQYRAAALPPLADRCAQLDAMERDTLADLAGLEVTA